MRSLENVPQLRTDDASHSSQRSNIDGIRLNTFTLKIFIQHPTTGNRRQPEQDAEGAYFKVPDMNKWIHAEKIPRTSSIRYAAESHFCWTLIPGRSHNIL